MNEKPLFIPLKREFYEAFRDGKKDTEYRRAGGRWNERTCRVGRRVILSLGYGKKYRMEGEICSFYTSDVPTKTDAWKSCYGSRDTSAACIGISSLVYL